MANRALSWLDGLLFGVRSIFVDDGSAVQALPDRPAMCLAGDVLVEDGSVTLPDGSVQKCYVVTCGATAAAGRFLTDASAAVNPNDQPIRALTATLGFVGQGVEPATFTRRDAAGTVENVLTLGRTITGSAAGTTGTGAALAFQLTDGTVGGASRPQVGRLRYGWENAATPGPLAYFALSVLGADGEHDVLTSNAQGDLTLNALSGFARTLQCEGIALSFDVKAAQRSGNGANAGVPTTISGGQGQNVASGTNNNGGALTLASGAAGTGGTGGTGGAVVIKTGATTRATFAADGTQLALTVDQVRLPYATTLAWRDSSNTVDKTILSLRASPDTLESDCLVVGGEGVFGAEYRVSADSAHVFLIDGNPALTVDGEGGVPRTTVGGPLKLLNVTLAGLAAYPAADYTGASVLVTDQTGGQGIASSNGTNWISDRTGTTVA